MQVILRDDLEKELKRIVSESRGLFSVCGLVTVIIDHWLFLRENEEKLKELYARPKK